MNNLSIPCNFRQQKEFSCLKNDGKTKCGRYHKSIFELPEHKDKKYIIASYLEGNFEEYINNKINEKEIVIGCINYLNSKISKKYNKPIYGNLEYYSHKLKQNATDNKIYIEVLLLTTDFDNNYFWNFKRDRNIKIKKHGRKKNK